MPLKVNDNVWPPVVAVPLVSFTVVAPAEPKLHVLMLLTFVNVAPDALTPFVVVQLPPMIGLFIQKSRIILLAALGAVTVTRYVTPVALTAELLISILREVTCEAYARPTTSGNPTTAKAESAATKYAAFRNIRMFLFITTYGPLL